jgi:hypothetical protein
MPKLATPKSDVLSGQRIDESGPGTILKDFQTLLDFVGTAGIQTGGKNYRLPLVSLATFDERMSHPLRPRLTRPQQLSFPHINGLYLLLRLTGLGVSSGQGNSGRLSVSSKRLDQWNALNPVERYFTLLHAMLTGSWGPIDTGSSRGGPWDDLQWDARGGYLSSSRPTKAGTPASVRFYNWTRQTTAALLELFGILEIPRVAPQDGENWRIAAVRRTAFGEALLSRLLDVEDSYFEVCGLAGERSDGEKKWLGDFIRDCFPDCRNTLAEDEDEFVDGLWQFKVSLGQVWRRIVVPADSDVDELIAVILTAFQFDDDHLYDVKIRDRSGRIVEIAHPACDDSEYFADEFAVGFLPLDPGQSMTLLYDYGDSWHFTIKLEKILPGEAKISKAKITAKHGQAPAQYNDPDGDDEW